MFDHAKSIHFIGVCGTAMASVAVALKERGVRVTGSDVNIYPPMSTFLAEHGIEPQPGYAAENLPPEVDLVVIGNAQSRGNPEVEAVLNQKLRYCSLPELLKEYFLRGKRVIVVTGTHGKTTTTALLAWVLEHAGLNPGYLIGGLARNFERGARFTDGDWFVIEGDEYDTAFFDKRSKFVHYLPEIGVINNLEFDHADIFPDLAAVQLSFQRFINVVPGNGLLLANGDEPGVAPLLDVKHCPVRRFGLGPSNDLRAADVVHEGDQSIFTVDGTTFHLPLTGEFNVRNALAAVAVARHCGLNDRQIQAAFDGFLGIRRRMEIRGEVKGVTVIDDFGHHPTAIRETVRALRNRFPGRRLWALFEPRSNTTRRNVLQRQLVDALAGADRIVIAEVARMDQLAPEVRLDTGRLLADLRTAQKPAAYLPGVSEIVAHVVEDARPGDVVCVFSNGGFGGIHDKLLAAIADT